MWYVCYVLKEIVCDAGILLTVFVRINLFVSFFKV